MNQKEAIKVSALQEKNSLSVNKNIFRAYDIRGIYPQEINADNVYLIARAIAKIIKDKNDDPVLICRDGRLSSNELKKSLINGLNDTGLNTIDIGELPTPLLNFAMNFSNIKNGLMITGSHNPKDFNGIKIVIDGLTLYGEYIDEIYNLITSNSLDDISTLGTSLEDNRIKDSYLDYLQPQFEFETKEKIVVDCGNGVTGKIMRDLRDKFKLDMTILNEQVDGDFPSHPPDPSNPDNLKELINAVQNCEADLGVAFDGDGDRIVLVTGNGSIIWPDQMMMIFSKDILNHNKGTIIFDIKCSRHLEEVIRSNGGTPIISRTGHSYIKRAIKENKALLGGEMSGHIFFNDDWFGFDDGIYSLMRMLKVLSKNETIEGLYMDLPDSITTHEISIEFNDNKHFTFMDKFVKLPEFSEVNKIEIDGLKLMYEDGWGLVRCSNTTPCIVLRFEADSKKAMLRIQSTVKSAMLKIDKNLEVPF